MPAVTIDGIVTRYELAGSGPALLMFSPGGFGAELENWSSFGIYRRLRPLGYLPARYTCIMFDRRESGQSGGRVERIGWDEYAAQGRGLLDHLGIDKAHLMGGCVGCSAVAAFAVRSPERVLSLSMLSPAGGPRYRITQQSRFARHLSFAADSGLPAVVSLAAASSQGFSQDPRLGPWVSVIRTDEEELLVLDLPALVVPGDDASHATSAARYFHECLTASRYWDVPVAEQDEESLGPVLLEFLASSGQARPD
jgi:pimeloyl-ACP methyl ester carboxylesterase